MVHTSRVHQMRAFHCQQNPRLMRCTLGVGKVDRMLLFMSRSDWLDLVQGSETLPYCYEL